MPVESSAREPDAVSFAFYRTVMTRLGEAGVPFVVGGAYALAHYTGVDRNTRDFDIFLRRADMCRAMDALAKGGYRTELTYPHWLGKVYCGDDFVDLIFSSGNAIATVDDDWFEHAHEAEVLGTQVKLSPPEEMIWSKAYIMERERFDGADVHHLLLKRGAELDWERLLRRFGAHWRVLFSHVVTFGFVYPGEKACIPAWVMKQMLARLGRETLARTGEGSICHGPLLSRAQYLVDIEKWGYTDSRLGPEGCMSLDDVTRWTAAIDEKA